MPLPGEQPSWTLILLGYGYWKTFVIMTTEGLSLLRSEDPPQKVILVLQVTLFVACKEGRQPWEARGPPHPERYLVSVCSV